MTAEGDACSARRYSGIERLLKKKAASLGGLSEFASREAFESLLQLCRDAAKAGVQLGADAVHDRDDHN